MDPSVAREYLVTRAWHEILVDKLAALVSRSALRDLLDIQVLLRAGGDLERAVRDAPRKDGGFSAMTLGWVLKGLEIASLAERLGWSPGQTEDLAAFRDQLALRLADLGRP